MKDKVLILALLTDEIKIRWLKSSDFLCTEITVCCGHRNVSERRAPLNRAFDQII